MRSVGNPLILKSSLSSDYTVTTSFTTVPGFKITISTDGVWLIIGGLQCYLDGTDSGHSLQSKLAINGKIIPDSLGYARHQDGANGNEVYLVTPIASLLSLKKGDVITVQVIATGNDTCQVRATNSVSSSTYMSAVKIG